MEDLRWEVVRLKEEVRAMRRELGEARGAREEMVSIYIYIHIFAHIYTYLNISTHIYTYLHILGQDIQADAGRHAAALQAEPRHKGHVTRDTSTVIYVIILSNGAGGLKSSTSLSVSDYYLHSTRMQVKLGTNFRQHIPILQIPDIYF